MENLESSLVSRNMYENALEKFKLFFTNELYDNPEKYKYEFLTFGDAYLKVLHATDKISKELNFRTLIYFTTDPLPSDIEDIQLDERYKNILFAFTLEYGFTRQVIIMRIDTSYNELDRKTIIYRHVSN